MQSILLVSKTKEKIEKYLQNLRKKNQIDPIDVTSVESEKSIGIEQIRNAQQKLFLKPIKSPIKLVVIDAAFDITVEAQNALLKMLEEPPANTIIVLAVSSKEAVLPTILSRCSLVELETQTAQLSEKEMKESANILVYLQSAGIGGKLKTAQDYGKSREEALAFLEKLILAGRNLLLEQTKNHKSASPTGGSSIINHKSLHSFQKAYTTIKTTNISPRFALENLFLNLSGN